MLEEHNRQAKIEFVRLFLVNTRTKQVHVQQDGTASSPSKMNNEFYIKRKNVKNWVY